jgi:hypothetical protein
MGIQVYDPGGRRTTQRSPFQPQAQASTRTIQDEGTRPSGGMYESIARLAAGMEPVAAKPKDGEGLAEKFFGTAVGSGLGKVINNPVVKSILQPLDVFGIPQRVIASTINEVADVFAGEGFSPKDWIDQVNPDAWLDGNMEGSIGMGDVWQKHGKALGAGKNQWVDAAVGLTGDIVTDPLTYFFGAGVVDKGLDALRTGSRLGAGIAAKGATKLDDFAALEAAVAKADDVAGGASRGVNEAVKKGSRRSLTGRSTRFDMIEEARDLIGRADEGVLNQLYGGPDVVREALEEIQFKSGRGLSASSGKISPQAQELVETALNIKPPAVRARVPFTRQQGVAVPGTEAFAQGLGNRMGGVRQRFNDSDLGTAMVAAKAYVDLQPAEMVMARGAGATAEEFKTASTAYGVAQGRRAVTGEYSVAAQNAIQGSRKKIMEEIKQRPGKNMREKNAAYMADVENPAIPTQLNVLFEALGGEMATRHGITIPKLDRGGSGGLDYVPHSYSPEFRRFLQTEKGNVFADDLVARLGGKVEQDLLGESGRLKSRQIGANLDLPVPGKDGVTFNTGNGSIDEINKAANAAGFKGRVLEDSPLKLIDDYIQVVSEDVGRRASRAEEIAKGNPDLRYSTEMYVDEALLEQRKASERLGLASDDESILAALDMHTQQVVDSRDAAAASVDARSQMKAANEALEAHAQPLTYVDNDRITRVMGTQALPDLVEDAYAKWIKVGSNNQVMMHPDADAMWKNVRKEISNPSKIASAYRELNKYFKNFAVLSPGFHVRNGMSAIFMNIADGVPIGTTRRGIGLWKEFSKASKDGSDLAGGMKFLDGLPPAERQAFGSVFGSGAGGRFTESGLVDGGVGIGVSQKLTENRVNRKSQDAGAFVEGAVRMGVAIDTIQNGGSVAQAVSRITRLHFDYSETSTFDDKAKQAMPFWSFFSRNIPLQTMQVWSRPGAYLAYEKIKNNFGQPEVFEGRQGEIPGYIEDGGGMPINLGPFGNWLEPDLPHTRVTEDIERYANILENPLGATTGLSPVLTAPLEYAFAKDAFTGQNFGPTDWEHVSNPVEVLMMLPLLPTSKVKYKDGNFFIKTEALNALQAIDPTLSRINRMSGSGGREKERTIESWLRYFGLPVRNITEKQMTNAAKSRSFDEADMRAMERSLQP